MKKHTGIALILLLISSFAFAEADSAAEKSARLVADFFYQCWKYEITGRSDFPEIEQYCGISDKPAKIMTLSFWSLSGKPMRICDIYFPEYAGFFDAFDYYSPGSDSGDWIDSMEFTEQNNFVVEPPVDFEAAETEISGLGQEDDKLINVPSIIGQDMEKLVQRKLRNSDKFLRLFSIGEERLSVSERENQKIVVNADKSKMVRKFFDDSLRLVKKENWKISGGLSGSSLVSTEAFTYGEGNIPVSCEIIKGIEKHLLSYDENGLVIKSKNYTFQNEKWQIESVTDWKFDDKKRILEKTTEKFQVKKGIPVSCSIIKEVYSYKIEDGSPDYSYFENGVLKLDTVYSSAEDYVTTTRFDGGFVIETYYQKGIKLKDLIYYNGELRRSRVYE